ncbi:MAG: protein translocase subunit SecF [Planctomycetia bacterium]|nr:protein translocase subunit SecF [Planctomycetia bacterium]
MYSVGTEQLRGFAVTLILGILMSMFTAIFCSRLVFDVFEKKRWIETLRMGKLLPHTDINFYGKMWPCLIASWVLIAVGMVAAFSRGTEFFDIDFRGGTKIQVAMKDAQDRAEVQHLLEADSSSQPKGSQLDDLTVQSVGKDKKSFDIETTQANPKLVEAAITRVLGPKIKTNQLHFDATKFTTIAAPAAQPGAPVEPAPPAVAPPAEEKKADDKKPEDGKATETKPEEKKADEKKAAEKAPEKKADETKSDAKSPEKPAEPGKAAPKSGASLRHGAAQFQYVMFADPEKKADAPKPADDVKKADATAPAGRNDPKSAAADDKEADTKKDGAKEAKESDAKDAPKDKKADEKKVDAPAAPAEKPADAPLGGVPAVDPNAAVEGMPPGMELAGAKESFVGGTEAQLHFDQPINQEVLSDMIQQAGVSVGLVRTQEAQKAAVEPEKGPATKAGNTPPPELNFRYKVSNSAVVGSSRLPENEWTLQTTLNKQDAAKLLARVQQQFIDKPTFAAATNVGGQVADDMKWVGLNAMLVSFGCIVAYVWFRFQEVRFGLAAVVALVHDVLVMIGMLALSKYLALIPGVGHFLQLEPFKMNLVVLAAVLTLVGYSLNDTIVIFDRIREMRGKSPRITPKIINDSVNQTLSRTLLTSFLTFMVVFILYFVGGPGVHGFAYALLVGIIVGTYSSIYIASPILILMQRTSPATSARSERDPNRSPAPAAG